MVDSLNINGNGLDRHCNYDQEQMQTLIDVTKENGNKLDTMVGQQKEVTKWLLAVVCIIALGSKLVEMANNIWGAKSTTVIQAGVNH